MPDEKPDFKPGDKVALDRCPRYSFETHQAKIIGYPQVHHGDWVVPIRYWCTAERKTATVSCSKLVKVKRGFNMNTKLSKPAKITGIVLVVILILGLWTGGNYNSLVTSQNSVDNSWAKVETQYQRRFDLIGNLVSSVKGAQGQEKVVFGKIADARTKYNSATTADDKAQAASDVETNVALLPRLQEAYPDLKSNATVQSLMSQLTATEDGIATKRDAYNDTVTNYNNNITRFPKNIFAGAFSFHKRTLFKADTSASQAPKVNFN